MRRNGPVSWVTGFIPTVTTNRIKTVTADDGIIIDSSKAITLDATNGAFIASKALRISDRAKQVTAEESGQGVLDHFENGGKLDAFRHAFWMASLGLTVNPRKAVNSPTTEVLYNTMLIPSIATNMTGTHPSFLNLRLS